MSCNRRPTRRSLNRSTFDPGVRACRAALRPQLIAWILPKALTTAGRPSDNSSEARPPLLRRSSVAATATTMQREAQLGFVAAMTLLAVPALLWTGAVRSDGVGALSASTAKVWNEAVAAAESGNALRAFQLEVELMSALMQLKPGVRFADIGAFDGRYAMRLVQKVLPGGSALLTDVQRQLPALKQLTASMADSTSVAAAAPGVTGLPPSTFDAILLRTSYHHQPTPAATLAQIDTALKPGGLVLIVENWARSERNRPDGPPRRQAYAGEPTVNCSDSTQAGTNRMDDHLHPLGAGMAIAKEVVMLEAQAAGFKPLVELNRWPWSRFGGQYAILFQKGEPWQI